MSRNILGLEITVGKEMKPISMKKTFLRVMVPSGILGTPSATYVCQFLFFYWNFYCLELVCPPYKCGILYFIQ